MEACLGSERENIATRVLRSSEVGSRSRVVLIVGWYVKAASEHSRRSSSCSYLGMGLARSLDAIVRLEIRLSNDRQKFALKTTVV